MSTSETDVSRNPSGTDANLNLETERRTYAEEEGREPYAIERDIDSTRADMRATLEALERRFSFDRLIDLTVGRIRERGGEFAGNLTDAATQNPVPLLLASVGIGWMMLASRRGPRERSFAYDSAAYDSAPGVRERMGEAADRVRGAAEATGDTLRSSAGRVADSAARVADGTRERVHDARARMEQMLDEQPLMLGALGLAAGAIVGALLPASEQENRLLGEARATAVANVARASRERLDAAREHAANEAAAARGAMTEGPATRPH
jgi:hypothetical protein